MNPTPDRQEEADREAVHQGETDHLLHEEAGLQRREADLLHLEKILALQEKRLSLPKQMGTDVQDLDLKIVSNCYSY